MLSFSAIISGHILNTDREFPAEQTRSWWSWSLLDWILAYDCYMCAIQCYRPIRTVQLKSANAWIDTKSCYSCTYRCEGFEWVNFLRYPEKGHENEEPRPRKAEKPTKIDPAPKLWVARCPIFWTMAGCMIPRPIRCKLYLIINIYFQNDKHNMFIN